METEKTDKLKSFEEKKDLMPEIDRIINQLNEVTDNDVRNALLTEAVTKLLYEIKNSLRDALGVIELTKAFLLENRKDDLPDIGYIG